MEEGFVSFRGYRIWYGIVGKQEEPKKLPLLCLHGGPGLPHDYLEPIGILADTDRPVIFYDQLGCGNSDQPHNPKMWNYQLFVEELNTVRRELGLGQVHLFGHSAGGSLAMEYALTNPSGLASLILADSYASVPQINSEMKRLRSELPTDIQQVLLDHEKNGTTSHPAYQAAASEFTRRHWCRLDPWPDCLLKSLQKYMRNPEVNDVMYGSSNFEVTGMLKDWNVVNRLCDIHAPTLLISGRYDQATPAVAETLMHGIKGAKWSMLGNSSHMPHLEETERFISILADFLSNVESNY